mgnify:CR=1 FL=1
MDLLLGILILCFAVAGMAIGVIFGKKPLSGSCGGLNESGNCSLCGEVKESCDLAETWYSYFNIWYLAFNRITSP